MSIIKKKLFGRKAPTPDARDLKFGSYIQDGIPAPVAKKTWSAKLPATSPKNDALGIMYNDVLGDCTCAGTGHCIQIWTSNLGKESTVADADILKVYEDVGGFVPTYSKAKPPVLESNKTDQGCAERDVLKYWVSNPISGHKISGYVAIDHKNHEHLKQAICLFGCSYAGMLVPDFCMKLNEKGLIWDLPAGEKPKATDGHCVVLVDYDDMGPTCITWGMRQKMTWAFYDAYFDEAWSVLSNDWLNAKSVSPSHFNLAQLNADLAALKKAA